MKLAWFTSFSKYSAIGKCSLSVLEALPNDVEVTVFASDIRRPNEALSCDFELQPLWGLDPDAVADRTRAFEAVVYNLGDHFPMHRRTYDVAVRMPGIVILHDLVMHHFFSGLYLGNARDAAGYLAELKYAHGDAGRRLGEAILNGHYGHEVWDGPLMLEYHMAKAAVRNCLGVVVHSDFSRRQLTQVACAPVRHIPFPAPLGAPQRESMPACAVQTSRRVKLITLGVVNRNKMIDQVIRAIGEHETLKSSVSYYVIGDHSHNEPYAEYLRGLIDEFGLRDCVHLLGRQPDEVLRQHLLEADVVVTLRNPHFGESSWSLLESMFAGKATLVWRHGYYDEVPDDTVLKISCHAELATALAGLCASQAQREELGARAAAYARQTYNAAEYGRTLLEFNGQVRYNAPALRLADFAAAALGELGATDELLIDRVAAEVSSVSGITR